MPKTSVISYRQSRKYEADYEIVSDKVIFNFAGMPRNVFQEVLAEVKGLEGATWDNDGKFWTFKSPAVSARNAFALGHLTGGDFPGSIPKPYDKYHNPIEINYLPTRPLYEHQISFVKHILSRRRVIIAGEMGTGKTLAAIEALEFIKQEFKKITEADHDLFWIVAPRSALKAWEYELKKWNCKVKPRLLVAHADGLKRAMKEAKFPPIMLILDESSCYKTPTSQRSTLMRTLSDLMQNTYQGAEYLIEMSGSPAPKDPCDWWSQAEIACPGYLREKSVNDMRKRLAYLDQQVGPQGQTFSRVIGWNNEEITRLYRRLKGLVEIKLKKDCLQLPEKVYSTVPLEPTPATKRLVQLILKSGVPAVQLRQKLSQLSDGFLYPDEDNKDTRYFQCPKYEWIEDKLDEFLINDKTRIIFFGAYQETIDQITKTCLSKGWAVIQVDGRGWKGFKSESLLPAPTQEQFLDLDLDKPLAFVANADAGGMGITLTSSDTIVYVSNSDNGQSRIQSEDRIHRPGSKGANIIDLIHLPTDERKLKMLKAKRDIQAMTLGEIVEDYAKLEAGVI